MKKSLLLVLIFINCSNIQAQQQKKTVFGLKAGYDHTSIDAKELSGAKSGFTGDQFYAGIFVNTRLTKKFSLETEVSFSYADEYHFLEAPVHIKYNVYKRWHIFAGPRIDYILEDEFEPGYHFAKWGIAAEAGLQFDISKYFFAETRYARSFTSQVDDYSLEFYGGKRNTFRVGLGVRF